MLKQIHEQLYLSERPYWHEAIKKHWRFSGVSIVNFHTFSYYFIVEFGEKFPAVFTSRDENIDK